MSLGFNALTELCRQRAADPRGCRVQRLGLSVEALGSQGLMQGLGSLGYMRVCMCVCVCFSHPRCGVAKSAITPARFSSAETTSRNRLECPQPETTVDSLEYPTPQTTVRLPTPPETTVRLPGVPKSETTADSLECPTPETTVRLSGVPNPGTPEL